MKRKTCLVPVKVELNMLKERRRKWKRWLNSSSTWLDWKSPRKHSRHVCVQISRDVLTREGRSTLGMGWSNPQAGDPDWIKKKEQTEGQNSLPAFGLCIVQTSYVMLLHAPSSVLRHYSGICPQPVGLTKPFPSSFSCFFCHYKKSHKNTACPFVAHSSVKVLSKSIPIFISNINLWVTATG